MTRSKDVLVTVTDGLPPTPPPDNGIPPDDEVEYDIMTITLFSSHKLMLNSFQDFWDVNHELEKLDLTDAVKARLHGFVRIMNVEAGVAVKVNDVELIAQSGENYSFDFPNMMAHLYQNYNKFTFTLYRIGGPWVPCLSYGTMTLNVYYPKGLMPKPPTKITPGCFIATAAYGSSLAPQLYVLRRFRDSMLPDLVTRFYYRISPPFARGISKSERLRRVFRGLLKPVVAAVRFVLAVA